MKLSKLASLAKNEKCIDVCVRNRIQYAVLRHAVYPLYGIPEIREPEELLSILDVPPDEREKWKVSFGKCELPEEMLLPEMGADEVRIDPLPVGLRFGGDGITVYDGGKMVKTKFLSPCDNVSAVCAGDGYIRLFKGLTLCGAVLLYVPTAELIDDAVPLFDYLIHIRDKLRYEEQMRIELESEDER